MTAWDRIFRRAQSYRGCFMDDKGHLSRAGEIVLTDLRRFCRGNSSTVAISPVMKTIDPLAMAMAEGRREVWLRIIETLNLDEHAVAKLKELREERNEYAA